MKSPRRCALLLAPLLLLTLVTGCSTASGYQPLTVAVRDHDTGAPVSSAFVQARPLNFFIPESQVPLLGDQPIVDPSPPTSEHGATGADGTVRLERVVVDQPVQIRVLARGYEPLEVDLTDHPAKKGASAWLDPLADTTRPFDAEEATRLEVRFLP